MKEQIVANSNIKDRLFRFYFNDKGRIKELYNAFFDTKDNIDEHDISINTLNNAIYLTYKNDISFVVQSFRLVLAEHQSTVNPNMPLRDVVYYATMLEKFMFDKSIYTGKLLKLPKPVFVVFYNGSKEAPEKEMLSFSDFYKDTVHDARMPELEEATLELKVLVLNINKGYNMELKEKCKSLNDYCIYVDKLKRFLSENMTLEEAVDRTIDECIKEGVMSNFLRDQKSEVRSMSILECDYEEELKKIKKFEREEGIEEGRKEGRKEGYKNQIRKKLEKGISDPETISDMLEIDVKTVKELLEELLS